VVEVQAEEAIITKALKEMLELMLLVEATQHLLMDTQVHPLA
jgi:hypothetical protein